MGRGVQRNGDAWEDSCDWQKDKITLKRINALIKDARRDPFNGIGKPEPPLHQRIPVLIRAAAAPVFEAAVRSFAAVLAGGYTADAVLS